MPGDFGLRGLQGVNDRTDANFIRSEQVNYTQPSSVGQSFEKLLNTEISMFHSVLILEWAEIQYDLHVSRVQVEEVSRKLRHIGDASDRAAAFHENRVAPNTFQLRDAFAITYFAEAAREVQIDAGKILRENAVLQSPNIIGF